MKQSFQLPTATRILDIQQDNYRTKTFVLDAQLDGDAAAYPGQFVMAWLPRFDEKPFSLVNANPVTLMITAVGPFSRLVHEKQIGDRLWIRGPFGRGFGVHANHKRLALIGGGYGVAPLLWLAREQASRVESITTIIGARTAQDVLYAERFAAFQQSAAQSTSQTAHIRTYITTEDGTQGEAGRVTDRLLPLLKNHEIDGIYACGPHGMLAALDRLGAEYGVARQLSWEAYMRCGIGICGSCEHEGSLLCLDGPVIQSTAYAA